MMKSRFSGLVRRVAVPLVAVALLAGPLTGAVAGTAFAQNTAADLYNSARGMLQQNDYAGAVDAFTQAINMDPSLAEALVGRATAYMYEGNAEAALQDYNQALQMQPNMAEALYNRGVLLAQTGDEQGAIRDLQQAAQLFRDRGDEQTAGLISSALDSLKK
jgi:Tfp pilus assembly protein PilF